MSATKKSALALAITALQDKLTKATETVANLTAKLAEQEGLLANFDRIAALTEGSTVIVKVGRGETRQSLAGEIIAVKEGEVTIEGEGEEAKEVVGERLFKVKVSRTGDAFDAEFVTVSESQVELPALEEVAEEEEAGE